MKRKLLSLLMVLSLMFGMLPASAFAVDAPDTAAFNSVTADVDGEIRICDAPAITLNVGGADFAETVHHRILLPEGAGTAYVSFGPDSVYAVDGTVYGFVCDAATGVGRESSLPCTVEGDGSISIEVPVFDYLTYMNEYGEYEGECFVPYDSNMQPVSILSFGYDLQAALYDAAAIPDGAPFTAISTDKGNVKAIEDKGLVNYTAYSTYENIPYYHVSIPEGSSEVYVTHPSSEDPFADSSYNSAYGYRAETEGWTGGGMSFSFEEADDGYKITLPLSGSATDWETGETTEYSFVADDSGYVGYAVAVERNDYSPIAFFSFEFVPAEEEPDTPDTPDTPANDWPFLSIAINGEVLSADKIVSKGPFDLGDWASEDDGDEDSYDYVHEDVPYYHVTVPCGTESVDVSYSADTKIMSYGSDAYGYRTELTVDAVSSPTVKGTTFKNAYTLNEDGTQTVKTPVTGYTFDADGNGMAITLEEPDGTYEAVCLFSFVYDGLNHKYTSEVTEPSCTEGGYTSYTCSCGHSYTDDETEAAGHSYTDGSCSVCGEADPDYVAPGGGAEIPDGAPFTAISTDAGDVSAIEDKGLVNYTGYSTYENIPYYHVSIPAGTTEVYVTHPGSEDPFADSSYNSAYGYYAETEGWTGGGMSFSFEGVEDGFKITLPLGGSATDWSTGETTEYSFVADDSGYVGYAVAVERNDYSPIAFFSFEYVKSSGGEEEPPHEHDYKAVTTVPGCDTQGYTTYTCSCGDSYVSDYKDSLGHAWVDADCLSPKRCTNCGSTEGEKLGHDWSDWATTTEPSCTENGEESRSCKRDGCQVSETKSIDKLGHSFSEEDGKCSNDGCEEIDPMFGAADQDENGVYQIGTADELVWFANAVNAGETALNAKLTSDIDLSEKTWPGIGNSSNKFAGSFDGGDNTVSLGSASCGLFGYAYGSSSAYAEIKNVTVEGSISASDSVAGIASYVQYVNITNCINRASVASSGTYAAGITVGLADYYNKYETSGVNISNCGNEGNISAEKAAAGILVGSKGGVVIDGCYNLGSISGNVSTTTKDGVGGIAGYLQGYKGACAVSNCYNLGTINGGTVSAGLVGNLYNGASISNCYNMGETYYAIAGNAYNKTSTVSNSYYLASASTEAVPSAKLHDGISAEQKTRNEMGAAEFAGTLGNSFKASCPAPVLSWQTAAEHKDTDGTGGCDVCGYGSDAKQEFDVSFASGSGYSFEGETKVTEGEDYSFTLIVADDYEKNSSFAVKVNGQTIEANDDGSYTYKNVIGNLNITVEGISKLPDTYKVSLPELGNGYKVTALSGIADGLEVSVNRGSDFKFKVEFANGFKAGSGFAVMANSSTLADLDGIYTISAVNANQSISVSGVELIPIEDTTDITMTLSYGNNVFYDVNGSSIMLKDISIPYFDLSLYGLEKFYYNPYCYVDEAGNIRGTFAQGNTETAYGVVTAIHAFIYITEVYYLGIDEEDAGKGLGHEQGFINTGGEDEILYWSGGAGSSFMFLWDHGSNLNYYVNYCYPLAYEGTGSTCDQIAIKDGNVLRVHLIEDKNVNGSNFPFFVANDSDGSFTFAADTFDSCTVKQGDALKLTLFRTASDGSYSTKYVTQSAQNLYWVSENELSNDVSDWNRDGFAGLGADEFVSDENGNISIDTTKLEPGTYYIGALGNETEGGYGDGSGFISAGDETGAAVFILTVEEGESSGDEGSEDEVVSGDMTGDNKVTAADAALIYAAVKNNTVLDEKQLEAADVSGDGKLTAADAALVYAYVKGNIDKFPNAK